MGVWSCIDGIDQDKWEYVSLGIMDDLQQLPDVVSALLPSPVIDDTAWSRAISGYGRLVELGGENEAEAVA
jgi:hypothetical protein